MNILGFNKIYDHLDKLNNWLNEHNMIITAELDMTNQCNNFCPKCTGLKEIEASLSYKDAVNYIDQMVDMDVRGLIFTGGGEPLVNKDTLNVLEYAKEKKIEVGIITNGLSMNPECHNTIAINCKWIRISIDAAEPELYKTTHGMKKESFYKVIDNIKALTQYCKGLKDKIKIGTAFLTSKETKSQMYAFSNLSRHLGVDYAQFRPFQGDKTDITEELNKCKELETDNFKIVASTQKYKFFQDDNVRPYKKCYGVNFRLVIAANSKVYVCCHQRSKEKYCLGDLKKKPLKDIWKNRHKIIDNIDFADCPSFCILDNTNRELWNIKQQREHKNFL